MNMNKEELQNVPRMISEKLAAQQQLIELLMNQVVDLSMMSKIELGDDVIEEITRLRKILNQNNFKYMENDNLKNEQQCAIHDVSSSTVIEPINCELSEGMKTYIEMLEWGNELFDEARKQLMIPKKMFGSK